MDTRTEMWDPRWFVYISADSLPQYKLTSMEQATLPTGYDVVEAHCYVVDIEWTDCEQIHSRIKDN